MRGWNDALDAVQNGKFIISDDHKTENCSEKPNNSLDKDTNVRSKEPKTELVNDSLILVKDLVDDEFNPYNEECMRCKHLKLKCEFIPTYCKFESRAEPQTDEEYINNLPWTEAGNGEQTDIEIARAIVHKAIDDTPIAEDAYPDLRQKMHDAVDNYEPQTDCAWGRGE